MNGKRISSLLFSIATCTFAVILCLTTVPAFAAQDVPTITVSKGDQINLAVSPLAGSEGTTATGIVP